MKKTIISIILSLLLLQHTWAQSLDEKSFEKRASEIELFISQTSPAYTEQNLKSINELKNYQHDNLIKKDQNEINNWLTNLNDNNKQIENLTSNISLGNFQLKINQLKEKNNEVSKYEAAQKSVYDIKNNINNTERLNKYIEMIDNSKPDILIKGVYTTLPAHEKALADQYKENKYYVIQNEGALVGIKKDIKTLNADIESTLKHQEIEINNIKDYQNKNESIKNQFNQLKNLHAQFIQYNYTLPSTWQMGLFSCEAKHLPTYIKYKNFPNLIAMRTSIQSEVGRSYTVHNVINLNKNSPNNLDMVYKCEKLGSFGSCLDNTEKKLCHLVEKCRSYMNISGLSYDRLKHFNDIKNIYPAELLETRKANFQDPTKFSIINEWNKLGKLGYLTPNELFQYFNPIIEKTKTMTQTTPEAFMATIKLFINQEKTKALNSLKSKPGYSSSSTKATDSKNSIEYTFATIQSELETILNDDKVEARSYQTCPASNNEKTIFCDNYKLFLQEVSKFSEFEEIPNHTADECPKVVFRLGEKKNSYQANKENESGTVKD